MVSIDFELDGIDAFTAELEDTREDYSDTNGYRVVNPVEYVYILEFGRGPIEPTNADVLRFEVDGEVVYTMRSGPVAPQPMIRPAVDEAKREVGGIARSAGSLDEFLYRTALAVQRGAQQRTPVDTGTARAAWSVRSL
jgi:hypothetical protein